MLGANAGNAEHGVFTGSRNLTNDFFVDLLDMNTEWSRRATNTRGATTDQGGEWTATPST